MSAGGQVSPGAIDTTPLPTSRMVSSNASNSARSANRLGTGLPSMPRCGIAKLLARRRDREAAVAGNDRGDTVEARRCERRVPEHLRVVVRVDVDEPGRDDTVAGVEDAVSVEVRRDLGDPPVGDPDIGAPTPCT